MSRPVLWLLGLYRHYRATRPAACRFDPTCSAYVFEAVQIHGAGRGLYLGCRRVLRCHPFGGRGYDPVPAVEPLTPHTASAAVAPSAEPADAAFSAGFTSRKHCHA